jgi:hypothetical protein
MAPRVRYLGKSTYADGRVVHEYTDGKDDWQVPDSVPQVDVPQSYMQDAEAAHREIRAEGPQALDELRNAYNELAARSREPVVGSPLPAGARGVARPHFPEAVPRYDLTAERYLGPKPDGTTLSSVPQEKVPVDVALAVGEGADTLNHEALHAAAYNAKPANYFQMGPRERQDWHMTAAAAATRPASPNYSSADKKHHAPHEAAEREQIQAAVAAFRRKIGLE